MNKLEKRAWWRRFTAVTWIEWQNHARISLCQAGMLKTFVGDVSEKGGNLRCDDLPPLTGGEVAIHCHGVSAGRAKLLRTLDDVQAGLCWVHPVATGPASVGEVLTIVVVFLLAEA